MSSIRSKDRSKNYLALIGNKQRRTFLEKIVSYLVLRLTGISKKVFLPIVYLFTVLITGQEIQIKNLSDAALELTKQNVTYDQRYFAIDYPNGDVPSNKGVCTDVVIRAYRKLGIDLQKEVHKDMKANFSLYPKIWGLKTTDKNIDHRRVPNLMKFFERKGTVKIKSIDPDDYLPGDIVCWNLTGGMTHIGIVVDKKSKDKKRNLIVHNIGAGQVLEDCIFDFKIIGHYRYR